MSNSNHKRNGQAADPRAFAASAQHLEVDAMQADALEKVADGELERLIDRLVDNELPQALRRPLLLELDKRPQGWRRCALAFLEAQAWQSGAGLAADAQDCSGLFDGIFSDEPYLPPAGLQHPVRQTPVNRFRISHASRPANGAGHFGPQARIKYLEVTPPGTGRLPREQASQEHEPQIATQSSSTSPAPATFFAKSLNALRSPGGLLSAMAACFLLAFMLGLAIRGGDAGGTSPNKPGSQFAQTGQDGINNGEHTANYPGTSSPGAGQLLNNAPPNALAADHAGGGGTPITNVSGSGTWGTVSLASNSSNPAEPPLELPVVEGPSMTDWFSTLPPPVRPETLAELRRTGHEVFTETKWVTVQLEDGKFAVVPVDEVQVRYVGGNNIQ